MQASRVLAGCAAGLALAGAVALAQPTEPVAPVPGGAPPTSDALSAEEVQKLFSGNTEVTTSMKRGDPTGRVYKSYHLPDGTYRLSEANGHRGKGSWFVDPLGRHCFRIEGKDKTKCDVIVREGDHYIRLRDGERRGQMTIEKGNPYDL